MAQMNEVQAAQTRPFYVPFAMFCSFWRNWYEKAREY